VRRSDFPLATRADSFYDGLVGEAKSVPSPILSLELCLLRSPFRCRVSFDTKAELYWSVELGLPPPKPHASPADFPVPEHQVSSRLNPSSFRCRSLFRSGNFSGYFLLGNGSSSFGCCPCVSVSGSMPSRSEFCYLSFPARAASAVFSLSSRVLQALQSFSLPLFCQSDFPCILVLRGISG
jgi:hypothetical protein